MKDALGKLLKVVTFLWRILPVLIEALNDLADDGVLNGSSRKRSKPVPADAETK